MLPQSSAISRLNSPASMQARFNSMFQAKFFQPFRSLPYMAATAIPATFTTGTASAQQQISWTTFVPAVAYHRAVVIAYGSSGMSDEFGKAIEEHGRQLAAAGILAVIPDFFQKSPPIPHGQPTRVFELILSRHSEWSQVLQDAVAAVKLLPGIKADSVGLLGFSLGGFLSLRIRREVKSLVSYFAPYQFPSATQKFAVLKGIGPSGNRNLSCCLLHGKADILVPTFNCENIAADLKQESNKELSVTYYDGANHGFVGNDLHNAEARTKALSQTISFFSRTL